MLKTFLGLLLLSALASSAATVQLKDKASVTGTILADKADQVVVDIGYTTLVIPRSQILQVLKEDVGSPASKPVPGSGLAKVNAVVGAKEFFTTSATPPRERSVRDLVNQLGEAVVQVRTPGGLGSGFFINEEGFLITNFHVTEGETQISVEVYHQTDGQLDRRVYKQVRIVAVEPVSCPTLTKGEFRYDFGDSVGMTPLMMMYTLGHDFMPPGIHAGGLRYHGDSALISQLYHAGEIEAKSYKQNSCFEGALLFARSEGIVPAPESSHAVRAAIDEAVLAKEEGKEKTILFGLSGHGQLDMAAYDSYLSGNLEDFEYPEEKIRAALERLPKVQL